MKAYRLVDWATQIYVLTVGLLILFLHGNAVPHWPGLVAAHALTLVLVHFLVRQESRGRGGAVLRFLRAYYPILLYTGLYRETGLVNRMFVSGYLDPLFMAWDQAWFGCQPSLVFMQHLPQRWVAEIFYGCYFSYYLMIAGVGLALLLRSRTQFAHFVTVVSLAFYACYFTYVFLPVVGPRIFYSEGDWVVAAAGLPGPPYWGVLSGPPPAYPDAVQSAWFYQIVFWIYRYFETEGAAFPSSHVTLALVTLYFSWIYLPKVRWIHLTLAIGLCTATVYCRYHYLVDVLAGLLTAGLLLVVANFLYRKLDTPPS